MSGIEAPYSTCKYCKKICQFETPVKRILLTQSTFLMNMLSEIKTGMLGNAVKLAMYKAAEVMKKDFDPLSPTQISVSYCIMAQISAKLELDDGLKDLLMKNFQKTLLYMYKKAKVLEESDKLYMDSGTPSQGIMSGDESYNTESSALSTSSSSTSSSSPPSASSKNIDQQTLAAKRAALRAKMGRETSSSTNESVSKEKSLSKRLKKTNKSSSGAFDSDYQPVSLQDKVYAWFEQDKKFMKIVAPNGFKKLPTKFLILFDPDTEGYLPKVKVDFVEKRVTTQDGFAKDIIIMRWVSSYDVSYNQDIAIGIGSNKKVVAGSFIGGIPKDESELAREFKKILKENPLDWDPLQIILNNDKRLKKMILKNISTRSPAPDYLDDIMVPITLKHGENGMGIFVKFFASKNTTPSKVLDLMEAIAEDLDNLYELDENIRMKKAKDSGLFDFSSTEKSSSSDFHFLPSPESIEIPTCPYCGRPFPEPDVEYRRCPYCLEKL